MYNELPMHQVRIVTDGGPWAIHDMPCPVCQRFKAILVLETGHFGPCSFCAQEGYELVRRSPALRRIRNFWRSLSWRDL
jgi:hypothetical protein